MSRRADRRARARATLAEGAPVVAVQAVPAAEPEPRLRRVRIPVAVVIRVAQAAARSAIGEIAAARAPGSPGGIEITRAEVAPLVAGIAEDVTAAVLREIARRFGEAEAEGAR